MISIPNERFRLSSSSSSSVSDFLPKLRNFNKSFRLKRTKSPTVSTSAAFKQFNARTQDKAGKVLPVIITVYSDKSFDFVVKQPPVAIQLKEAAKVKSGSAQPNRDKVGEVTWEQIEAIARDKMPDLNCFTVEAAMRMVAGTARSMGINVKVVQFTIQRSMSKLTKNQKNAYAKVEPNKAYKLAEAAALLKEITFTKFDASVDIDVRLGVDPRKANQMVRGVVTLPHGTGKTVRVLVLCTPEKEEEAKAAGADYVGLDEYVEKIKGGWTDVDVIITTPNVMGKVGALGRILGPRGLMPNPKTGTVTMDVAKAVSEVKAGKIDFKVDKFGIVHTSIGKVSFSPEQIVDNANEFLSMIMKLKPSAAKGSYVKSIYLSSTMSPGLQIDAKSVETK